MTFFKKKNLIVCAAIGAALSMVITLLLLLVVSWAVNARFIPQSSTNIAIYVAVFLAVLIGAAEIARWRGKDYIACSMLCALGYIVVAMIVYALGIRKIEFFGWFMRIFLVTASAGLLSGMITLRHKAGRKGKRKKRI